MCDPNCRSIQRKKKAKVTDGIANSSPTDVVKVPQLMIGRRLIDMPGARSRRMVTTKLIDPSVVEIPSMMFAR